MVHPEQQRESEKEISPAEMLKHLRSEEYFADQKKIQLALVVNEKALRSATQVFRNRRNVGEVLITDIGRMTDEGMNTFPEYDKNESGYALAVQDPRKTVKQIRSEWEAYSRDHRDDVGALFETMSIFCKKYGLDFNPYFRDDVDAQTLWHELKKTYGARMFELQNNMLPGENNVHDV